MSRLLQAAGALGVLGAAKGNCGGLLLFLRAAEHTYPLELTLDATVGDLRKEAAKAVGRHGLLLFGGEPLPDDSTPVADSGMTPECVVVCALQAELRCVRQSETVSATPQPDGAVLVRKDEGHSNGVALFKPTFTVPTTSAVTFRVLVGGPVRGSCYGIGVLQGTPDAAGYARLLPHVQRVRHVLVA
eukprot:TRINITY_DN3797_c0_g1_i3.p1 TRINITY_DN3797_c0_g1~~TRINITY_DN3797_c0_g1_i3.p1  ORF type:complete len:187 (+),score=51.66 TRINITY_DN3797_c0_g1_i3:91-651(+)